RVEARLDDLANNAGKIARRNTPENLPEPLQVPVQRYTATLLRGLAGDQGYDTFNSNLEERKSQLANAAGSVAADRINAQLDDEISISSEMSASQKSTAERAAQAVQLVDTLGLVLPILAVILIGLMYLASRSIVVTSGALGISLLLVGGLSLLALGAASEAATSMINGIETDAAAMIATELIDQLFTALRSRSYGLLVGGMLFTFIAGASKLGWLNTLQGHVSSILPR
ncbi:MAG: hypothetical protein ABEI52_05135, partial [Halobacteriaceae archaeon]